MTTSAVVICVYTDERWDDILTAVDSVLRQQPAADDVIVVVDHNPVLHSRLTEQLTGVRVVANQNERGLSGARNTGVALAEADVVVFLDDDAAAQPGWLADILSRYDDSRVLGVGGRIEPAWDAGRPAWWPSEFDWVVGCTYTGQSTGVVRNLIGANASFRRELFTNGGFTTGIGRSAEVALPVGCEETEFCIRAGQAHPDGVFLHIDCAAVRHRVPAARQTFSYFRSRCYSEGLSKALVTSSIGVGDGLSSEWTYSTITLPKGVLRGLGRAVRGDVNGLLSAGAIIIGLTYTTVGYLVGTVAARRRIR